MLNPLFQSHFLEDFPTWIADDRYQTKHDEVLFQQLPTLKSLPSKSQCVFSRYHILVFDMKRTFWWEKVIIIRQPKYSVPGVLLLTGTYTTEMLSHWKSLMLVVVVVVPVYVSTPIRSQERESTLLTPQYLQWVLFAPKLSRFFGNISNIDFKLVGWQKDTKQQKPPKVPQAKRPSRLGLPARVRLELNGWT